MVRRWLVGLDGLEPSTSALSVLIGLFGLSAATSDCAANQDFLQLTPPAATPSLPPHGVLTWPELGQTVVKGCRKLGTIWSQ